MSAVLDRPFTDLGSDLVEWDELAPPCEALLCEDNPADWACKHRHFDPVSCKEEGTIYLICDPCYEQIKSHSALCITCREPASVYAVERIN